MPYNDININSLDRASQNIQATKDEADFNQIKHAKAERHANIHLSQLNGYDVTYFAYRNNIDYTTCKKHVA